MLNTLVCFHQGFNILAIFINKVGMTRQKCVFQKVLKLSEYKNDKTKKKDSDLRYWSGHDEF